MSRTKSNGVQHTLVDAMFTQSNRSHDLMPNNTSANERANYYR